MHILLRRAGLSVQSHALHLVHNTRDLSAQSVVCRCVIALPQQLRLSLLVVQILQTSQFLCLVILLHDRVSDILIQHLLAPLLDPTLFAELWVMGYKYPLVCCKWSYNHIPSLTEVASWDQSNVTQVYTHHLQETVSQTWLCSLRGNIEGICPTKWYHILPLPPSPCVHTVYTWTCKILLYPSAVLEKVLPFLFPHILHTDYDFWF